ncbi:kinase-like protein [Rickenella mellea]|uniref:Kinase-like protein n=1 Tax=Rickenella mellea TaxID=50990 RepID=A0A4Y7Q5F2_9AGAM|nr:kinase-like protein [Rickenella mellea]
MCTLRNSKFKDRQQQVTASTGPDDRIHIQCEQTLRRLCGRAGLLPSSFILKDELCKDGEHAITAGGFADVFSGTYKGKKVALKALRVYGNENLKKVQKSFCREAVFWRRFSHPNIVPFLGISDPKLFPLCMVSQWMANGNLLVYLRRYPRANRLNLLVGVAEGLLYLHQIGIVHGDVKSANILIDDAHRACLADFGLACITHDARTASAITTSTAMHGSIRWMAPELLHPEQAGREDSRASAESDIYALGMVILETFTGKIPFHHHMRDATVVLDVTLGMRPDRPGSEATALGLSDLVWSLIEVCWQTAWRARPRIDFVLQCLKEAQSNFVPPEEDELQSGEKERSDSEYSTDDEDDARRPFRRGEMDTLAAGTSERRSDDRHTKILQTSRNPHLIRSGLLTSEPIRYSRPFETRQEPRRRRRVFVLTSCQTRSHVSYSKNGPRRPMRRRRMI